MRPSSDEPYRRSRSPNRRSPTMHLCSRAMHRGSCAIHLWSGAMYLGILCDAPLLPRGALAVRHDGPPLGGPFPAQVGCTRRR